MELGYAFKCIGPERLVCVMNEVHGDAAETMFDIAHRRRPIAYTSPRDGFTVKQSTSILADRLVDALKPIIALGLTATAGESNVGDATFADEVTAIKTHWQGTVAGKSPGPTLFFSLRPAVYVNRRFANIDAIEEVLTRSRVVDLRRQHHYPSNERGTNVMEWGLFNNTYRWPDWAMCYSGQLWAAVPLGADCEYAFSEREQSLYKYDRRTDQPIAAGAWIDYRHALINIGDIFKFAGSFATAFRTEDQLIWSGKIEGLSGMTCASSSERLFVCSRECASPTVTVGGSISAGEFAESWHERLLDLLEELMTRFDFLGRRIGRKELQKFVDAAAAGQAVL
jgi:hypothetical protein